MSVVIIGGNECMECQYKEICKEHGCRVKVFTKEKGAFKKKLGTPDLMVLFVGTTSHKMAVSALQEAKRRKVPVARCHTSSACALDSLLRSVRAEGLSANAV